MANPRAELEKHLEPVAVECGVYDEDRAALSIAISLKRIADALERMGDQDNAYQIGMAIGNGINRTMTEAGR